MPIQRLNRDTFVLRVPEVETTIGGNPNLRYEVIALLRQLPAGRYEVGDRNRPRWKLYYVGHVYYERSSEAGAWKPVDGSITPHPLTDELKMFLHTVCMREFWSGLVEPDVWRSTEVMNVHDLDTR